MDLEPRHSSIRMQSIVGRGPAFFPFDRVLEFLPRLNRAKSVRRLPQELHLTLFPPGVNRERKVRSHNQPMNQKILPDAEVFSNFGAGKSVEQQMKGKHVL